MSSLREWIKGLVLFLFFFSILLITGSHLKEPLSRSRQILQNRHYNGENSWSKIPIRAAERSRKAGGNGRC
jgi:hypothetical protein